MPHHDLPLGILSCQRCWLTRLGPITAWDSDTKTGVDPDTRGRRIISEQRAVYDSDCRHLQPSVIKRESDRVPHAFLVWRLRCMEQAWEDSDAAANRIRDSERTIWA